MKDPKRLVEGAESPTTIALLSAGKWEAPSPELIDRVVQAAAVGAGVTAAVSSAGASGGADLGLAGSSTLSAGAGSLPTAMAPSGSVVAMKVTTAGTAALGAAGNAATAGGAWSFAAVKWLGATVVSLAAASSAPSLRSWVQTQLLHDASIMESRPPLGSAEPDTSPHRPSDAKLRLEDAPVESPDPSSEAISPALPVPPPAAELTRDWGGESSARPVEQGQSRTSKRERPAPTRAPASSGTDTSALGEELALLDRARAALQAGDTARTLRELEHYERQHAQHQLELEVALLRMEAHALQGDAARAQEIATDLLRRPITSAQAARAREVMRAGNGK